MARKDRNQNEERVEGDEDNFTVTEDAPAAVSEAPDLAGLVKMRKGGQEIHANPLVIKEHEKNGWKVA